jgi:Putative auto-transporter adhesin, head GIN domain
MTMRRRTWIVASALSVASGCNGSFLRGIPAIQGSGIAKEETRPVEAFHAIEAENALQVTVAVTQGAKSSLKISGDDNLVPLVESVVRDGKLILRIKDNSNIRTKTPLLAEVMTDVLDQVTASGASTVKVTGGSKVDRFTAEASGAAQVSVDGIQTPHAIATATGASHVVLSGSAESLKVDAAGASQVKAEGLKVDDADVSISGASNVELRASKSVAGEVSGASRLDLQGRPAKKNVSTSGASQVNDKE